MTFKVFMVRHHTSMNPKFGVLQKVSSIWEPSLMLQLLIMSLRSLLSNNFITHLQKLMLVPNFLSHLF